MFSQMLFEWLKLFATPLTVALSSIWLNKTIQTQNTNAQRQSSYLQRQADEFLKVTSVINDEATSVVMAFWWAVHLETQNRFERATEDVGLDISPQWRGLQRAQWDMCRYLPLAPRSGTELSEATDQLLNEVNGWAEKHGGNVETFREKQLAFNARVRTVHAEILALEISNAR